MLNGRYLLDVIVMGRPENQGTNSRFQIGTGIIDEFSIGIEYFLMD